MAANIVPHAESAHLYLTNAESDKEYTMCLEEKDGGWVFNYAFGKRGSKLKPGTKTPVPVDYATAKKEYDKQMKGQLAKRYTTNVDGQTLADNPQAERFTDLLPQLLNPVSQDDAVGIEAMLTDDAWVAQEKHNGERRMIRADAQGQVIGTNRLGQTISLAEPLRTALTTLIQQAPAGFVLDGEDMNDHLVVFDLLELDGKDLRAISYAGRLKALEALISASTNEVTLRLIQTAHTTETKRNLMAEVRNQLGEGVVFKKRQAPHTANRPAAGGPQIKVKFLETATVRVAALSSTKRSVEVEMRESDGRSRAMGKLPIPANAPMPAVGDLVELEYLYVVKGGSFTQPTYEKPRRDQTWEANCGVDQLKEVASRAKAAPKRKRTP